MALAEVQSEYGLVKPDQVADLRLHMSEINIPRALEIETETQHDLMAELQTFAEQCPVGGGILHFGATSSDIEDNADALRLAGWALTIDPKSFITFKDHGHADRQMGRHPTDGDHPPPTCRTDHPGLPAGTLRTGFVA